MTGLPMAAAAQTRPPIRVGQAARWDTGTSWRSGDGESRWRGGDGGVDDRQRGDVSERWYHVSAGINPGTAGGGRQATSWCVKTSSLLSLFSSFRERQPSEREPHRASRCSRRSDRARMLRQPPGGSAMSSAYGWREPAATAVDRAWIATLAPTLLRALHATDL